MLRNNAKFTANYATTVKLQDLRVRFASLRGHRVTGLGVDVDAAGRVGRFPRGPRASSSGGPDTLGGRSCAPPV